jgi:hypothetical protein
MGLLSSDIREIEFRKIRCAGRVEDAREMRIAYIILVQSVELMETYV